MSAQEAEFRILKTDAVTDAVLGEVAQRLHHSKLSALKLAVETFAQITEEMAAGAQVVVVSKDGQRRALTLEAPAAPTAGV